MTRKIACVVATMAMLGALAPPASAVFCRRKSGVLVARAHRCRPKELQAQLEVAGPPGPPGAKGETGPAGQAEQLRDARGAFAATFVAGYPMRRIDGRLFMLPLFAPSGFSNACQVAFPTPDCSGLPLLFPSDFGFPIGGFATPVLLYGGVGYYLGDVVVDRMIMAYQSCGETADTCTRFGPATFTPPDHCCRPVGGATLPVTVHETMSLDIGSLGLVPPFHVEGLP